MPEKTPKDVLFEELSLNGLNAKKQYRVGNSIIAIAFPGQKAAIEVDDSSHENPAVKAADEKRDADLESRGWRVLRLRANDVESDTTKAAMDVEHFVGDAPETANDSEEEPASSTASEIKALVKAVDNVPARIQPKPTAQIPAAKPQPAQKSAKIPETKILKPKTKTDYDIPKYKIEKPRQSDFRNVPAKIAETKLRKPKISAAKINNVKNKSSGKQPKKNINKKEIRREADVKGIPKKSAKHQHKARKSNPDAKMLRILVICAIALLFVWGIILAFKKFG